MGTATVPAAAEDHRLAGSTAPDPAGSIPPWRRRAAVVVFLFVAFAVLATVPALAQEGPAVQGTLATQDDEPVEGVEIVVEDGSGVVGTTTTDADGSWLVEVPDTGSYAVILNEATLPDDVVLRGGRDTLDVTVRSDRRPLTVNFTLGEERGATDVLLRRLQRLPQLTLQGVRLGLIIAMAAIGLSLVFGTTRLINFAHGDMVTFGAVLAWFLNTGGMNLAFAIPTAVLVVAGLLVSVRAGLWQPLKRRSEPSVQYGVAGAGVLVGVGLGVVLAWLLTGSGIQIIPAALIATIGGGALGAVMERGLWRPLRDRKTGLVQMLVISIGFALLLRHVILLAFGGRSQPYMDYTIQSSMHFGPLRITPRDLVLVILSVLILVAVGLLLQRTRLGKAMRAVSDNRDLAESSGINVRGIILLVWVMGGGLAALGGVLFGITQAVNWHMGFELLLYMFAGVILGGIGTAFGALVGSLAVGLVTELSALVVSPELKLVWALVVLILVLLVRPQGILGVRERVG